MIEKAGRLSELRPQNSTACLSLPDPTNRLKAMPWFAIRVKPNFEHVSARLLRGKGFDETAIASDRKGVAESIRGRMARHGGRADVRSALGEGTEVALTMPRR